MNGAVDPSQNGKYAAPVMTLAKKIGIPVVLVDIRMEASHQELPELELLRHGTERALQWLFERYWAAQRAALDALHGQALAAVAELVAAEAGRRVKAAKALSVAAANRGKHTKKKNQPGRKGGAGKRRRGQSSDEDSGSSSSSSSEEEEAEGEAEGGAGGRSQEVKGHAARRKDAMNALVSTVNKDDTATAVKALITAAMAVARLEAEAARAAAARRESGSTTAATLADAAEEGAGDGEDMRIDDWIEVASRLKKQWKFLHEELALAAVNKALDPPASPLPPRGSAAAAAAEVEAAAASAVARAAVAMLAAALETGPDKRSSSGLADMVQAGAAGHGPNASEVGPAARRRALAWHLLRRVLALPDPTPGQVALGEALLAAVGSGRKFSAKAGALLSGVAPKSKDGGGGGVDASSDAHKLDAVARAAGGEPRSKKQRSGPAPVCAGKFTLVQDWVPCAIGDLPVHLRGGSSTGVSSAVGSGEAAEPGPGGAHWSAHHDGGVGSGRDGGGVVADLLWGAWPQCGYPYVGFGVAAPGVDYSTGAPFVDPTRRVVAGYEDEAGLGEEYDLAVPDVCVIGYEELASGNRPIRTVAAAAAAATAGFVHKPGRAAGVGAGGGAGLEDAIAEGFRGGESFSFVDDEDDQVTEELEGYELEEGGEEVEGGKDVEMEVVDAVDAIEAGRGGAENNSEEEKEEEESQGEERQEEEEEDDGEDGNEKGGPQDENGTAVSIGGVRVVLSAQDLSAVASNVECLM